jgi:alpha-mannosidase
VASCASWLSDSANRAIRFLLTGLFWERWPPANPSSDSRPAWRYPDDYVGLKPGYIKQASLGWYASHHHTAEGLNEPYQYSYLFVYSLDIPEGARTLTLPNNDKIRILAVSVVDDSPSLVPAAPLFDTLGRSEP